MRILVTGASGLLGGGVARLLVWQGHTVTTFQRRPAGVDGATDLAVGIPGYDGGGTTNGGAVAIWANGTLSGAEALATARLSGYANP